MNDALTQSQHDEVYDRIKLPWRALDPIEEALIEQCVIFWTLRMRVRASLLRHTRLTTT